MNWQSRVCDVALDALKEADLIDSGSNSSRPEDSLRLLAARLNKIVEDSKPENFGDAFEEQFQENPGDL